jgi:hypothetical protein
VRVLAHEGLLVFQLPSHTIRRTPPADAVRSAVVRPLSQRACHAGLSISQAALCGHAGERMLIDVRVENRSPELWPSLPDARGRCQINVANRWLDADGALLQRDDERTALPNDVPAGGTADVLIGVRPPAVNGRYVLEIDLVQEHVGWFGEQGSPTLRVPCDVTGGLEGPPLTPIRMERGARTQPRFSERHPRMFAALRATGLRDLYWAARRAIDGAKTFRDRGIRRWMHPLLNRWERVSFAPRMEMHCVTRAEVTAIVHAAGARVVDVEEEMMPGGYVSCRYWVVRQPSS